MTTPYSASRTKRLHRSLYWLWLCLVATQSLAGTQSRDNSKLEIFPEAGPAIKAQAPVATQKLKTENKDTFDDRCRSIFEFAQLGDVDATGLAYLRSSCG